MKTIKCMVIMSLFCFLMVANSFAAGADTQAKINQFKADVAAVGLEQAISKALEQGLDLTSIASTALAMGQSPESLSQSVMNAAQSRNIDLTAATTALAGAGVGLQTIATAALSSGFTPANVTTSVMSTASALNMNPNSAIVSLSQAGVPTTVISQVTGRSQEQINSIVASGGQGQGGNQNNNQQDQGLGFQQDPGLGGQGANPNNPPGNPGQTGGGSIGGGGQKPPVSPNRP